jgi:hypothetical protein
VGTRQTRWIYFRKKCKSYKSRWSLHRHYRKRNGFDAWRHDSRPLQKKRRSQKTVRNRIFHSSKNSYDQKFYLETKLKANEIELFLQFCEADQNQEQLQQTTIRWVRWIFCSPKHGFKTRYFKKIIYFSSLWTNWQLFIQPPDTSIQHSCETYPS